MKSDEAISEGKKVLPAWKNFVHFVQPIWIRNITHPPFFLFIHMLQCKFDLWTYSGSLFAFALQNENNFG